MDDRKQTLGDLVRSRRQQLGMSQRELAAKINMSHSTLSRLETTPGAFADTRTLVALSEALDLDLTTMLARNHYIPDQPEIALIARARRKMPPEERDRMMQLLRTEFEQFFDDGDTGLPPESL